jgi:hypothetical protein
MRGCLVNFLSSTPSTMVRAVRTSLMLVMITGTGHYCDVFTSANIEYPVGTIGYAARRNEVRG